jgi:hypothetical protein
MDLRFLGRTGYEATVVAMQEFTRTRNGTRDELWICEHSPHFTQGLAGKAENVLNPGDIPVVATNRGGQVTYHGPGQVVAYPLLDLQRMGYFVKEYVYRLEDAVIRTLDHFGVTGHRVAGAPASMCAWTTRAAMPCWSSARSTAKRAARRPSRISRAWARLPPWASRSAATAPTTGGPQCRYGFGTLFANQPLRIRRAEDGGPFYNRRTDNLGRGRIRAGPPAEGASLPEGKIMSTNEVVREAQSAENYNPLAKQKAAAKLARIPVKVEQAEVLKKPEWIRVKAGSPSTRFTRSRTFCARTICTRSARKPAARISASALARARPPS